MHNTYFDLFSAMCGLFKSRFTPASKGLCPDDEEEDSYIPDIADLEKQAEKGDPEQMYMLGIMLQSGIGVAQDFQKARFWFEKAAVRDNPMAWYKMGYLYHFGLGVEQDFQEAARWYEKAAQENIEFAQYALGYMHQEGLGVEKDPAKAFEYYKKAACKGHLKSKYMLGNCYEYGIGTLVNTFQSKHWYQKAARKNFRPAQLKLREQYPELDADDVRSCSSQYGAPFTAAHDCHDVCRGCPEPCSEAAKPPETAKATAKSSSI